AFSLLLHCALLGRQREAVEQAVTAGADQPFLAAASRVMSRRPGGIVVMGDSIAAQQGIRVSPGMRERIMTGPAFFKNVVPLNRDRHRRLKLRMDGRATFAAGTHFVPLAAVELYEAARDYPIVFTGSEDASPVAILGLRAGENLFIDANGRWANGTYVPAFVRRYPFILSRGGQAPTDYTV